MSDVSSQSFWSFRTQPGAWTISGLYLLESIARASVATVIPLTAYDIFGSKETVSLVYTCVALVAFCFSFATPYLIRRISRRWTYSLGTAFTATCAVMLVIGIAPSQVLAMFFRTAGAAMLNVTLALYIMDNISKYQLVRSEPLRFSVATLAWGTLPFVGVWLYQTYGVWAASLVSFCSALLLLAFFWFLRMREKGPIRAAVSGPPNPLRSIRRFVAQPRMRLAWMIAFGRSAFWVTFFIYGPILMVEGGYGPKAGGFIVALGNLMLFVNIFIGRVARRYTLRRVLAVAFWASALLVLATGLLGPDHAFLAGCTFVAAALFASILDGLGPVPFLRAVHAWERPQMTTVYRTYLDASELIPPLVYFFLFQAFGFAGAFAALALWLVICGVTVWKYLPRQM